MSLIGYLHTASPGAALILPLTTLAGLLAGGLARPSRAASCGARGVSPGDDVCISWAPTGWSMLSCCRFLFLSCHVDFLFRELCVRVLCPCFLVLLSSSYVEVFYVV